MRKAQRLPTAAKAQSQPAVALVNREHLAGHRLRDRRIRLARHRLLDAEANRARSDAVVHRPAAAISG